MTSDNKIRLSKLAKEFNVGVGTLVEFLHKRGYDVENNPNAKVDQDVVTILEKEFGSELDLKKKTEQQKENLKALRDKKKTISIDDIEKDEDDFSDEPSDDEIIIKTNTIETVTPTIEVEKPKIDLKVKGKIDLDTLGKKPKEPKPEPKPEEKPTPVKEQPSTPKEEKMEKPQPEEVIKPNFNVEEPKVVRKIDTDKAGKTPTHGEHKKTEHQPHQKDEKSQPKEVIKEPASELEKTAPAEPEVTATTQESEPEIYRAEVEKLSGLTIKGKIDLSRFEVKKKPVASSSDFDKEGKKKKRKRIKKGDKVGVEQPHEVKVDKEANKDDLKAKKLKKKNKKKVIRPEVDEEEVQRQIKETLARLTSKGKTKSSKYRREKREILSARQREELERQEQEKQVLKVSEFVSANELAAMMNVPVTDVIDVCMNLGLMVSINQRLDAETMALVADEFGYKVEFVSVDVHEVIKEEEEDKPEDSKPRSPIVTVMGHVDHGKTSLLDYIRHSNVIAGEAGGITQHIGAYSVELDDGRKITFLDTPGHEAFTAMRARGAKLTDVAIIVVAADDAVMPQTVEAINHASAAGVPIVFAINKIDKPTADPERIKGELANMNYLVEDWGGKYQCQEISAKKGLNVDKLLEKVLLEAELKDLKANPNRRASGTVIESALDKGRGYVATVLVQNGTLRQGDIMLAGIYYGHVKAMFNERGQRIHEAGPSTPVQVIGLNGAPQAGDYFNILDSDREAREIANKREQLVRMQSMKTKKHITLDEIGRRIAIGNFRELNLVVKGDVDGSIEALSDSLIKLSTEQVQVNVIHKAVGQISESDILLAAASNAIVIGFQVRPSAGARKLAEKEEIDIRLYSIIYDAINEIKDAIEGMLAPEIKEEITGSAEVLETFKITKVGTVAGCIVREGKISRSNKVRLIRDGIVIYTGELESLKRFKDDVREVSSGFECGLNIKNFNDIKVGDIVEGFQEVEVKRKL